MYGVRFKNLGTDFDGLFIVNFMGKNACDITGDYPIRQFETIELANEYIETLYGGHLNYEVAEVID